MSLITSSLAAHADRTPERTAVQGDHATLSYAALVREVDRFAAVLRARAPRAIGLLADNGPAWIVVDLASAAARIPLVPIPPFFSATQVSHVIGDAGLDVVIAARDFPGSASSVIEAADDTLFWIATGAAPGPVPAGTAKITYTSGTTGSPKGVCLSQSHLEQVAHSLVTVLGRDLAERHIAVLPLAVLLENVAGLYPTLMAGGTQIAPGLRSLGFDTGLIPDWAVFADALRHHRATSCILVPELLKGLVAALDATHRSLPDMRYIAVGGARTSPMLMDRARALGLPVYEGYGLSECGSVVAVNTPARQRRGSVGQILPHQTVAIDPDGAILIRNPGFLGYLRQASGDHRTFPTGDLGGIDADGYLSISGRKKNVIITSLGRNIAPEWIESELALDPAIGQSVVFGDDDDHLTALIVARSAAVPDSDLARAVADANDRLPPYARIGAWRRIPPLSVAEGTLTGNGRPRRERIAVRHLKVASGPTFFDRLVAATAADKAALFAVPQIVDGVAGRITRATYVHYLTEAYHHVRHTVPLLREAQGLLPADRAWLGPVLQKYVDEEAGHERWILNDIANAGGDAAAVEHGQPRPQTAAMVDHAYRFIRTANPVGLFGMVFVLEGTSVELASRGAQALMASLKLPLNCFSYLTSHGALDIEHMGFFRNTVDRLTSHDDQDAVIAMAKAMFHLFAEVFRAIPHSRGLSDAA